MNTAYNSSILAWMTGGESLHNNHHAHPRSPRFSVRRSEFDPSWLVIRALAAVKLVAIVGALGVLQPAGEAAALGDLLAGLRAAEARDPED